VLYLYKTKKALVKAVVDRIVSADEAINEAAIHSIEGEKNAAIRGRILAASGLMTEGSRSIALNLCASVANDSQLRLLGKDYMKRTVERIRKTCDHPNGAMLAYLALEGVKLLELVDWHTWDERERKRLLKQIEWLIQTSPQEATSSVKPRLRNYSGKTGGHSQTKRRVNLLEVAKTAPKSRDRKKRQSSAKPTVSRKKV
jgi:hypothetical protein